MIGFQTMLKIDGLSVSYGSRRVLHDVSLNVQSGEVAALIGPNGAGKSTLVRAASGVIPVDSGTVRTNGTDLLALRLSRRLYTCLRPSPSGKPFCSDAHPT
jgi:branched-chain amino acid transport system ATP-binding protein